MTEELLAAAGRVIGASSTRPAAGDVDLVDGVVPGVIVAPETVDEVAATLAWATREKLSVVIRGAGTKNNWGRRPDRVDVCLSLARLNRVLEHAASDLTATIEAGAPLAQVNASLARSGQFLPLDPPFGDRATIGGVLATNDSGALRHRYGTPSDLVLGATFVTADGLVAKSGGKVVKNVAGYDLARLLAGSHGSLAVVVSATFKLFPVAEATSTIVINASTPTLLGIQSAMTDRQLEPMAVEAVFARTAGALDESLVVRFGADRHTAAASVAELQTLASAAGAISSVVAETSEPGVWGSLTARAFERTCVARLSWLPANRDRMLDAVQSAAGSLDWVLVGRAGVGAGHIGFDGSIDDASRLIETLRRNADVAHVVLVRGPHALRERVDVWPASSSSPLWPALKTSWDPTRTLGAGRGAL